MPAPRPRAIGAASTNASCASCHVEAAKAWGASAHAHAFTDPVFQKALAEERSAFCRDCHAPETDTRETGVSCVTCHDPRGKGEILAAREPTHAPHAVRVDAAFATERACANCHEFSFPGRPDAMQRTVSEHRVSSAAGAACAACHGAHDVTVDASMVKRSLAARASRDGERLVLHLTARGVGHSVPTGDLFRRLVVSAEAVGDDDLVLAEAERTLGRHFRYESNVQREVSDDRVSGSRDVAFDLGPVARGRPVAWRIEWQRVAAMHGEHADIAERIVIVEGREP